MEAVSEHQTEAGIAGPPPRRIWLPRRMTLLLLLAYALLGLFMLGSGRALWEAAKLFWLSQEGRTVAGQIIEIQREPAGDPEKPPLPVAFRYAVEIPNSGGALHRSGWIGLGRGRDGQPRAMPERQLGQPLPVRYAPWFGGVASQPWQPPPQGRMVTLTLSGSLVLLVSLLLIGHLTRWGKQRLRLLRNGIATTGTIMHKRTELTDITHFYIRYGYATQSGVGQEREEQVSQEQWKRFEVGQPVTVLFHPDQPEEAGLYALIRM